jgi:hypothetical protein
MTATSDQPLTPPRSLLKPDLVESLSLLVLIVVIGYRLFVPPLIGMADNSDFNRVLQRVGLEHVPTEYGDKFFLYVNSKYKVTATTSTDLEYKTSTELFARAARWLGVTFIDNQLFDIRLLGALYLILFLLAIYLALLASRPWRLRVRVLLALLIIFIFTDVAYLAYFNSFYSEPTAVVCLLLAVGFGLLLVSRQSTSWLLLVSYFTAAAILITAKPMYVVFALPLGLFGVYLSGLITLRHRYKLGITMACALCALAVWYQAQTPSWLRLHSNFIGIFMDLLPHSETREQDLHDLGLEPYWERYVGGNPYEAKSPLHLPALKNDFEQHVNSLTLPTFYLLRPGRLFPLTQRCARQALIARIDYLGYYEKDSGKPIGSYPPATWSAIRNVVFPKNLWILAGFFLVGATVAVAGAIRQPARRAWFALYGMLLTIAAMQFMIPSLMMGEHDLARYLLLYNIIFDISLIMLLVALFNLGIVRLANLPLRHFRKWRKSN